MSPPSGAPGAGRRDREPLPARRRAGRAPAPGGRSSCSPTAGSTARASSSPRSRSGAPSCSRTSGASGSSTTSTASASSSRRETPTALATAIAGVLEDEAGRAALEAASERAASGPFSWEAVAGRHEAVYRELVRVTPPPFFIVGCDRSGTTMLRLILDGSPDVAIPTESMILVDFAGQAGDRARHRRGVRRGSPAPSGAIRRCASGASPAMPPLREGRTGPAAYRAALEAPFLAYAELHGKPRWADKTPYYVGELDQVKRVFPEARIVNLVRDGRDVALSLLRVPVRPRERLGRRPPVAGGRRRGRHRLCPLWRTTSSRSATRTSFPTPSPSCGGCARSARSPTGHRCSRSRTAAAGRLAPVRRGGSPSSTRGSGRARWGSGARG